MNGDSPKRPLGTWLFNPFIFLAGSKALLIGLVAILAAGFIGSFSNTHFDGVLGVHSGKAGPLWIFICEGLIDWLCLTLVLLVIGKIASKTPFRLIDLFGTQAMARWPTLITSLVVLPGGFSRYNQYFLWKFAHVGEEVAVKGPDVLVFCFGMIVMLLDLCWCVVLMYRSYSISCNLKGGKGIGTFVAGLLIAGIVSNILILVILTQSL